MTFAHHKLPSKPTLSAIVQKLQSTGHNAPITVVFCNDTTSVTREVTGQWTVVKVVLGRLFGGYSLGSSCNFTEVRPVLAAGQWLAHPPEPCAESLETDLGTYTDKI